MGPNQVLDISKETDIAKLKALAYDQIRAKEQAEMSLRNVNQRINELELSPNAPAGGPTPESGADAPTEA